ncbi:hypothetical protein [Ideonella sp. BN130291]|uniref:hypothetical protein n=1 Tax=Ideonella sp. BN130291 TaxID=3112940 RepID=UPI002E252A04|nr:hypothetical protein [Ideonella sp. BN130291]
MKLLSCIALPLAALAACAPYAPSHLSAGASMADVTRELGSPTGRYALPDGGTRLEFARGPYGRHTYMVDLDAQGRVLQWQQVLTEANFNQVRAGESGEELLRQLGRPSERRSGDWQGGQVWSYRYETLMGLCQWFQVSVNDQQTVTSSAYGIDPRCDVNDKDRSRE